MVDNSNAAKPTGETGLYRRFRPGIRTWLVGMIVVIVAVAELASYLNAAGVLHAAVRDREADKAAIVGRVVEGMLETHASRLRGMAALLQTHPVVVDAIRTGDAAARPEFTEAVQKLWTSLQLDALEFTDRTETVVYRAQDPARRGDKALGWGVSEALSGQPSLVAVTHKTDQSTDLMIQAVAPLERSGATVGAVIVGMKVNDRFISDVAKEASAQLVLISRDGKRVASSVGANTDLDVDAIQLAFDNKIPYAHTGSVLGATVLYVPILLVDEAFVVQVALDSQSAFRVFAAGARHSAIVAGLIALVAVILAVAMLRFALAPLRQLRLRTARLARETTGQDITIAGDSDEIGSTVQALDAVTEHLLLQNRELAAARDSAVKASAAKSAFLSSMSHEIRTPLNGVLGMADLLQRTRLTAEQRKYCDAIRGSGRQLHGLLSDVLDLAKIEAGKLTLEVVDFDCHALVHEIGSAYKVLAAERGTTLLTAIAPSVAARLRGDPTRLRQVLTNLLGNAVKFTQGGHIKFTIDARSAHDAGEGTILELRIADTGIGIPRDKLSTLFSPFTQADTSTTRTHGGTGLGLAICHRIVQMMGGNIRIESEIGKGTTVVLELPLEEARFSEPDKIEPEIGSADRLTGHILVAEDNPVNQIVVSEMLSALGLECTVVDNGEKAIEAVEGRRFDLVLMDCQMPVLDGYVATARIRALAPDRCDVPIVALTANAFAEDRQRCLDAGMSDYLSKPVTMNALGTTIRRWLRNVQPLAAPNPAPPPAESAKDSIAHEVLQSLASQLSVRAAGKIVCAYIEAAAELGTKLMESSARRDFDAFANAAHALKSSSRSVGALMLGDSAEHAEALARARNAAAFDATARLIQQLDDACLELGRHPYALEVAA